MTFDERASNLLFLLTLPLALGCPGTEEDDDDTGGTPAGSTTTAPGEDTGTSTTDGTSATDGASTLPPADSTTTEPVDTSDYSCDDLMPPMPMGPISPVCMQYSALTVECYDGDPACIAIYEAYCQYTIEYSTMAFGEACGMAYEEFLACLSQLTCEQVTDDAEDCPDELMALDMVCMGK